jgi:hypothetical protein
MSQELHFVCGRSCISFDGIVIAKFPSNCVHSADIQMNKLNHFPKRVELHDMLHQKASLDVYVRNPKIILQSFFDGALSPFRYLKNLWCNVLGVHSIEPS